MELYREYVRDRKRVYGARRVKKEKGVRKRHFHEKKARIQALAIEAKEMGLTRWQAERHIEKGILETDQIHIYGSFVIFIIQALITWLIRRMLDNYFNDKD